MFEYIDMCRLCLAGSFDSSLIGIFTDNHVLKSTDGIAYSLVQIIEDFTTLKVVENDGMPQKICEKCYEALNMMFEFRDISLNSFNILQKEQMKPIVKEANSLDSIDDYIVQETKEQNERKERKTKKEQNEQIQIEEISDNSETDKPKRKGKGNKKSTKKGVIQSVKRNSSKKRCCEICGKCFDAGKRLQYHMNVHSGLRPYECKFEGCNKKYPSPIRMHEHYKMCHTDFYKYKCDICQKQFKVSTSYKVHMTYHFDPKIPCDICGRLVRNKRALQKHLIIHTGERPFPCDQCTKSFQNRYTLNVHKRVHTKEKPFICSKCGEPFGYNCLLKSHMEKHHPEECS